MSFPRIHIPLFHLALTYENERRIRSALETLGVDASLRSCVVGNGGSSYELHAMELKRNHGTIMRGVDALYGNASADWIIPFSWSAGYGMMRALAAEFARTGIPPRVGGWCASDSGYGSDDDPALDKGIPLPEHVSVYDPLVSAARDNKFAYVWGTGDVPTTYASPAQIGRAIVARAGLPLVTHGGSGDYPRLLGETVAGLFRMRLYDAAPGRGVEEHLAFARDLGVRLLAETVGMVLGMTPPQRSTDTAPVRRMMLRLGDRGVPGSELYAQVCDMQRGVGCLVVDGHWGFKETELKVRAFQRLHKLPEQSMWQDREWATLDRVRGVTAVPCDSVPPTDPSPEIIRTDNSAPTLAEALVSAARADLGVGEDLGKNDGKRIRELADLLPANVTTRWTPGANWCAVAAFGWFVQACNAIGIPVPIIGTHGAKALLAQLKAEGYGYINALVIKKGAVLLPGAIVFWDRAQPGKPQTEWWGHVGVVVDSGAGTKFQTIEGNNGPLGDKVCLMQRTRSDKQLIGAILLP